MSAHSTSPEGPEPTPDREPQIDLFSQDVRRLAGTSRDAGGDGSHHVAADDAATASGREIFGVIRERLRSAVAGHAAVCDRLALLCTQHHLGVSVSPARAVLIGPSGSGKSTILRALCNALPVPNAHAFLDANDLSESGWYGTNVADVLTTLWHQAGESTAVMARSVLVVDEFDKLSTRHATGASLDFQRSRQRTVLPLFGGSPLRFSAIGGHDRSLVWDSRRALIVAAGVFRGLPRDPRPHDLVRLGFMHELVERMGSLLRLGPMSVADASRVLRGGLQDQIATYAALGFELRIADAACGMVARAIADGTLRVGTRQAVGLLASAAQERLLTLLDSGAPTGTLVVLTPDDVQLPFVRGLR